MSAGDDLLAPRTTQYCEVMAWVHADDHKVEQQRISFTRPDGTPGSITVSQTHMAYRLTANTAVGATAASVADLGAFELVKAIEVKPADKLVVRTKGAADKAGFAVVRVQKNEGVRTEGLYLPVIEQPYLVVDGVVMPLWTSFTTPVVTPDGPASAGAPNALMHMLFSSLFMQRLQPVGTPCLKGQWDGQPLFPGARAVLKALKEKKGMAVDLAQAQQLFKPKYDAWRAARDSQGRQPAPEVSFDRALSMIDKVLVPAKN